MKRRIMTAFLALCAVLALPAFAAAVVPIQETALVSNGIYAVLPYDPVSKTDSKYLCDAYSVTYTVSEESGVNYDITVSAQDLQAYRIKTGGSVWHWASFVVVPEGDGAEEIELLKFSGLKEHREEINKTVWDSLSPISLQTQVYDETDGLCVSFPTDVGVFPSNGAWYFAFQWLDADGVAIPGCEQVVCRVRLAQDFSLAQMSEVIPLYPHDNSEINPAPDAELCSSYQVQSVQTCDLQKGCYTQVSITTSSLAKYQFLPKHYDGAETSVGYWVGFSVCAPENAVHFRTSEGVKVGRIRVGFEAYGNTASEYYVYFGFDVSEVANRDTEVSVIWYDEDYKCMGESRYHVNINATLASEEANVGTTPQFTDVPLDSWYFQAIDYVTKQGLMPAVSETTFSPDGNATRSTVVTILYRLAGEPEVKKLVEYSDVPANASYAKAVSWAATTGIAGGYGNGTFGPNDSVTREQLTVFLYRYEQWKGGGFTGAWNYNLDYSDAKQVSPWAYEAVCWYTKNHVLSGTNGALMPQGTTTRAQLAVILERFCETKSGK